MRHTISAIFLVMAAAASAATPAMHFQRTVLTGDGLPKANLEVKVKVAIHAAAPDGQVVFGEEHTTATSPAGVAYVTIGSQNEYTSLESLDWAGTDYYLESAIDSGNGYEDTAVQQILTVPYAVHAATASALQLSAPNGTVYNVTIADDGTLTASPVK